MSLTKEITKVVDNQTVGASSDLSLANSTQIDTTTLINLAIEVQVTFDASATAGATVKLFASYDGTNYDDNPYDQFDIPFTAGGTIETTIAVNPAPKYLKVGVTNEDASYSITAFSAWSHAQAA